MRLPDDYRDEMDRLSSQDADEVLAGHRRGSGAARVAGAAADRLRQELLVTPSPEVAERHLAAMRAALSDPEIQGGSSMRVRARKRFATLGLAASLMLGAGIAAALTLPDTAAERAKENTADVEAPQGPGNQGDDANTQSEIASEHGKAVSEAAKDDSTEGCEHGRAVSDLASSKADDNRKNHGDKPGDCGPSRGNGAAASAAKGDNGNHGQGNNGKAGQRGNAGGSNGGGSSGNGGQGSDGKGPSAEQRGKSDLPHGREGAPGQTQDDSSETETRPVDLPAGG